MIFFTADQHFGHENIISLAGRPFSSVLEMNEEMVSRWNGKVGESDVVYILGDLFFRCDNVERILERLRGQKILITGNHDPSWMDGVDLARYFVSSCHSMEVQGDGRAYTLCHYPMLTWRGECRSYMIHGHIHANTDLDFWPLIKGRERVLNAGVEVNDYAPVTFEELLANNMRFKQVN